MPRLLVKSYFVFCFATLVAAKAAQAQDNVNFARQVLPILSDKCFVCHGPDAQDPDLLRLDSFSGATADLGGYRAIDPDDVSSSEIIQRIHSTDDPMPPEEAEKALTPEERDLITRWVLQGGQYQKHWAFVPPVRKVAEADVHGNAIDHFIQKDLKSRGIEFAGEAPRTTLARRAALILTGLPPESDQLIAFLQDKRADAYERYIDQLLASRRFGEHQARYWLDAVRYGDTHGLHLDNRRGIYPYRDWVVDAFNNNLPLDKFIHWQLAGDLLPDPTLQQLVATGYVRMNPTTAEGGAIASEFQAKNNFDRTENFGTVFLGMSLTCARCHNHKYDPISQREYYQLLAFFNSTAEPSLDGNSYTYGPVAAVPANLEAWQQWNALADERERLLRSAEKLAQDNDFRSALLDYAQRAARLSTANWRITSPVGSDQQAPLPEEYVPAENFPGESKYHLPKPDQAVWLAFDVRSDVNQTIQLEIRAGEESQVWIDEELVETAVRSIELPVKKGEQVVRIKLAGIGQQPLISVEVSTRWQPLADKGAWNRCAGQEQLRMMADTRGPFRNRTLSKRAGELLVRLAAARSEFTTSLIARELPQPRKTRLLERGEYDKPIGEILEPDVFQVMGGLPADAMRNRLSLAKWLTAPEHPLVSRVLVNRIWQRTFGHGLVRTPEDFGLQGQQPTHPDLLDYLAVELIESGWNLKQMLKLMVTSQTFKQDSAWRPGIDDPENRLFARGPRFRLDAEVLRDVGLWSSGLLQPEMGGEGIKPYQPEGMWKAMAHPASNTKQYVPDQGERLYRRSLYVYWKRTSPHPMMTIFDAPSRESSCVRRSRTNTPLQSLAMFNETQRVEMARVLAQRLMQSHAEDARRLEQLFTMLACRPPSPVEQKACLRLLRSSKQRFGDAPDDARALLAIGEANRDDSLDPAEHAAWTQLVITVLASDISIMVY